MLKEALLKITDGEYKRDPPQVYKAIIYKRDGEHYKPAYNSAIEFLNDVMKDDPLWYSANTYQIRSIQIFIKNITHPKFPFISEADEVHKTLSSPSLIAAQRRYYMNHRDEIRLKQKRYTQNNQEAIKAYNKNYNKTQRDKIVQRAREKRVECECGSNIQRNSFKAHLNAKKHIDFVRASKLIQH